MSQKEQWNNDPEYRVKVLRELEAKWKIQFPKKEFGIIAYSKEFKNENI